MKLNKDIIIVSMVLLAFPVVWTFAPRQHGVKVYNCSITEISPDFPVEVKDQCRKLRTESAK